MKLSRSEYPYLPLDVIDLFVPDMEHRGVSEVARSPRGFLTAYRKARGEPAALSPEWRRQRENFLARHMAQVRERGETLFDAEGRLTRRHLALIAWAYSPFPGMLE